MTIFKKEVPDKYFVGVLFTPHLFKYLSLYVLAKGTDKSKTIRGQMEVWMEDCKKQSPEEVLIHELVRKIIDEWIARKSGLTVVTFANFKKETEYDLMDKGIDKEYIQIILDQLERHEAHKKTRTPQ